jgi:hypothetical protein
MRIKLYIVYRLIIGGINIYNNEVKKIIINLNRFLELLI